MEKLQTIWKFFRKIWNFPDNLEIFQTFWKLSRQFGILLENLEAFQVFYTFQTIQKNSRQNHNFPDNFETFKTIWKFSRRSRNFPETSVIFQTSSGRAKTFRGAMLPRSLRISVLALQRDRLIQFYPHVLNIKNSLFLLKVQRFQTLLQNIYKINFFGGVGHKINNQSTDPGILYRCKHIVKTWSIKNVLTFCSLLQRNCLWN